MTTMMSYSKDGKTLGRCDARCHEATTPQIQCECICGGAYHGAARGGRLEQIRHHQGPQIANAARHWANANGYELDVPDQQQLFWPTSLM